MKRAGELELDNEGSGYLFVGIAVIFWAVILFYEWAASMHQHDLGDNDGSVRWGVFMFVTFAFSVMSTKIVVKVVTFLHKHKTPPKSVRWLTTLTAIAIAAFPLYTKIPTFGIFGSGLPTQLWTAITSASALVATWLILRLLWLLFDVSGYSSSLKVSNPSSET